MKKKKLIIIWVILVVVLVAIIYGIPYAKSLASSKATLEKGTMESAEDVTVYIARDEVVYGAPFTGTVEQLSKEGSLEKKGTQIINMTATAEPTEEEKSTKYDEVVADLGEGMVVMEDLTSQRKGIVSYSVDGNEGKITLETIYDLNWPQMEALISAPIDLTRDEAVKGEPVYKIADNAMWAMIFWTDITADNVYEVGDRVTVDFGDDQVRASVMEAEYEGEQQRVILETNRYYANFAKTRQADVEIISSEREGIIAPKDAIVTIDDTTGVYIVSTSGSTTFIPVYILMERGDEVLLVEDVFYDEEGAPIETVIPYQEVLTNPEDIEKVTEEKEKLQEENQQKTEEESESKATEE